MLKKATCRECWARVEIESMDEYGLMRCPKCRAFFHSRGNGFPWSWWAIGVIVLLCVIGRYALYPIQSVDASEGWHLRHDR